MLNTDIYPTDLKFFTMLTPFNFPYYLNDNLRERDHWGDPEIDGRIILRWVYRVWDVGYGLD
jgi:hypothetical protein